MISTISRRIIPSIITILVFAVLAPGVSVQAVAQDGIRWVALHEAQDEAARYEKLVFVFVEAEWCGQCKRMKQAVFPDDDIRSLMSDRYVAVSIDLDSREPVAFNGESFSMRDFAREMQVRATPTIIFLGPDGEVLGTQAGFLGTDDLLALLRYVDSEEFRRSDQR